ncbi:PhoX family protein [Candidimonas nitroreducens]|uniref:Alkaline phosphatase n=1 Tax=Candidimonas nitroreducens TaxID=683354 RepID=A0A225MD40_9BURK|nr:alkaline phosphatase PhoX [Candidimonas nitroreducens]OWT56889.1 alkaline phosphatase [Candidimonas nitroreducens]
MPDQSLLPRRKALKLLAGAPMLPLTLGASSLLAKPGTANAAGAKAGYVAAQFIGMPAPTLDDPAAMATTSVGSTLRVRYSDGGTRDVKLAYTPFFKTGDMVADGKGGRILAGGYLDINAQPIIDKSVPGKERPFFSDCPDGTSLLTVENARIEGIKGKPVFAVVQFEYLSRNQKGDDMYGTMPSPVAILTLDQDPATGHLSLVQYRTVDTSGAHGLWITCGASLSPWNTHLSSEEYEPDALSIDHDKPFRAFSQNLYGDSAKANPYHYGHLPEVTVHPDGSGTLKKHYCLGRISHELIQVMPDKRTALMGDDATNGGLFMFIADKPADLSAGTLYAAQWHQTSGEGPGSADLSWIRLGHATSAEIEALADRLKIADIADVRTKDPQDASFTKIPFSGKTNWIKLKPGMEKAAAFLETHRYAALKGASMGFTKMEGTTVNAHDKIAYSAMSYITASMLNGSGGIKVQGPEAGAVYALNLKGGQKDAGGQPIASEWVPVDMAAPAALIGKMLQAPDALGNLADPDRIANPDNIKFSEKLRTLFIGEDTSLHVNNFLWAYNVDTRQLARVLSTPAGAEATGLHAVDEINGWTYIMSNFQHAGDWKLKKDKESGKIKGGLHAVVYEKLDPLIDANYRDKFAASVGYLTGVSLAGKPA